MLAEGAQDNVHLWRKIKHVEDSIAHLVSARIVQFAKQYEATFLVFEHLGNLKPAKGKYSLHRSVRSCGALPSGVSLNPNLNQTLPK